MNDMIITHQSKIVDFKYDTLDFKDTDEIFSTLAQISKIL